VLRVGDMDERECVCGFKLWKILLDPPCFKRRLYKTVTSNQTGRHRQAAYRPFFLHLTIVTSDESRHPHSVGTSSSRHQDPGTIFLLQQRQRPVGSRRQRRSLGSRARLCQCSSSKVRLLPCQSRRDEASSLSLAES
jgi:hypothetical protein